MAVVLTAVVAGFMVEEAVHSVRRAVAGAVT
jgi:hypothetical protein